MDINSILFQDEQLLWSGKGTPQRSLKTIRRYLLIFGFVLLFLGLAIYYGVTTEDSTIIIGIIVALIFCALCGYGFVYQIFLKPKKVLQKEYYLTNQRAIIYDTITYEYCYGFLMSFSEFRIDNYANGYGDVYMGKI